MVYSRLGGIQPWGSAISVRLCVCGCVYRLLRSNFTHDTALLHHATISRSPFRCDNFFTTRVSRDSVTAVRRRYQLAIACLQSDTWSVCCWVEAVQCPYVDLLYYPNHSTLVGVGRCSFLQLTVPSISFGTFIIDCVMQQTLLLLQSVRRGRTNTRYVQSHYNVVLERKKVVRATLCARFR